MRIRVTHRHRCWFVEVAGIRSDFVTQAGSGVAKREMIRHRMKASVSRCVLGTALAFSLAAQELEIGPDQETYTTLPEVPVPVNVELKSTLPAGLFSYGIRLVYDPASGVVTTEDSITVPRELSFNGVEGPGAMKTVEADFAGVKGTIDFFADPTNITSVPCWRLSS